MMEDFGFFEDPKETAEHFTAKVDAAKEHLGKRKGPSVLWMREMEDDTKVVMQKYDLSNGIPTMARSLCDWDKGVACLAGLPNAGKSSILVTMMTQSLDLNPDLMICDLSLDDPMDKRYTQYMCSLTGLFYQEITSDVGLSDTKKKLLADADAKLKAWIAEDRLRTYEPKEFIKLSNGKERTLNMRNFKNLFTTMKKLRKQYPERKIAFFIDAWNNLDPTTGRGGGGELTQTNNCLDDLQEVANKEGIMVMLSAHLRKTMGKKSTLEDIKGTSNMAYTALWAAIVRNEFRENALIDPLMFEEGDRQYPVIVLDIVKNKVSTWDMDLFYGLKAGQCQVIPFDPATYAQMQEIYRSPRK